MIDVQSAEVLWLADESARSRPGTPTSDTALIREMVAGIDFPSPGGSSSRSYEEEPRSRKYHLTPTGPPLIDQDLRVVQGRLGELGYDPGPIDGLMGEQTRTALRQFQLDHDLPQTGEPDVATKRALGLE